MNSVVKGVLLIVLFVAFFEAGLISSYTIVTGQAPDVNKLISSQIDELSSLLSFLHSSKTPKQETVKILNPDDVANALQNKSSLDGVNIQTLTAYTNESTSNDRINITLTVMAYKTTTTSGNVTNGSIIIKPNETYSITATAIAKTQSGGVVVDVNSIIITSIRKLYSNTGNIT